MDEIEDGVHLVRGMPTGEYDLLCKVPGGLGAVAVVSWNRSKSQKIVVNLAARDDLLGGVVRHLSGEPVRGAVVRDVTGKTRSLYCTTDERGRFRFCRAEGAASASVSFTLLDEFGEAGIADFEAPIEVVWGNLAYVATARPRSQVEVRLATESGHPIGEFSVDAKFKPAHHDIVRATKRYFANDGVARVAGLATGEAELLVAPESAWLPIRAKVTVAPDGSGSANLVTRAATRLEGTVSSTTGVLPRRGVVALLEQVGADDGDAVAKPGLSIRPASADANTGIRRVVVDGRFRFGCDPRFAYRLRIEAPGHSSFERTVRAVDGAFLGVDVRLQPTHSLRAEVLPRQAASWLQRYREQHTGGAREGSFALVRRGSTRGAKRTEFTAELSGDGKLEFAGVSSGKWLLWLRGPTRPNLLAKLDLASSQVVELPPIDLEHLRPGRVRGQLKWNREAIRPVSVRAMAEGGGNIEVPVAADGGFEFDAPAGTYRLRFTVNSSGRSLDVSQARATQILAGLTTHESIILELRRLSLLVVDNNTGAPIPKVTLSIAEDRATGSYRRLTTDESGAVILYPCPLEDFGLSVLDEATGAWTPPVRVVVRGPNPLTVRVQR